MSAAAPHVTFGGLVRSEWIKLWSLRSTWWLYAITIVLFIGVAALAASSSGTWSASYLNPANGPTTGGSEPPAALLAVERNQEMVRWAASALIFAQLIVSVLGVLSMAGEFGTGMVKSTLAAAPRRTGALLSKLLVLFLASALVAAIGTVLATIAATAIMTSNGWNLDFTDPYLWRVLAGIVGYVGFAGALGVLVGAIIPVQAGAIPTVIGILLVLPIIMQLLGALLGWDWLTDAAQFLPNNLGGSVYGYPIVEAQRAAAPDLGFSGSVSSTPWFDWIDLGDGRRRLAIGDGAAGLLLLAWLILGWIIAQPLTKRRDV